ncbi:hypothetical protein ACQ4PT_012791 [Festuca glaucescens]
MVGLRTRSAIPIGARSAAYPDPPPLRVPTLSTQLPTSAWDRPPDPVPGPTSQPAGVAAKQDPLSTAGCKKTESYSCLRFDLTPPAAAAPLSPPAFRLRSPSQLAAAPAGTPSGPMEMARAPAPASSRPRTVEAIYKDFAARRDGLVRALTSDKENLCLYGNPDGSWEVALPAEEVPPELPEPALGINFARNGMHRRDWLSLVAVHSDSWLLSVAFFFAAPLSANERKRLFSLINDHPNVYESMVARKHSSGKSRHSSKPKVHRLIHPAQRREDVHPKNSRAVARGTEEDDDEEEDEEHSETFCGSCGGIYSASEFWIGCDICERWFHGKCVRITPAKAEHIKHYKCPDCSSSKKIRQ